MLYVFSIQQKTTIPESQDRHLSVAIRCQEQMSMIAEEHSLARRYCLVLDELRKEAIRHSEQHLDNQNMASADGPHSEQLENLSPAEAVLGENGGFDQQQLTSEVNDINGFDASPGSSLYDMSGWGTFDSMVGKQKPHVKKCEDNANLIKVTSGFGNLEDLLGDGSFQFSDSTQRVLESNYY